MSEGARRGAKPWLLKLVPMAAKAWSESGEDVGSMNCTVDPLTDEIVSMDEFVDACEQKYSLSKQQDALPVELFVESNGHIKALGTGSKIDVRPQRSEAYTASCKSRYQMANTKTRGTKLQDFRELAKPAAALAASKKCPKPDRRTKIRLDKDGLTDRLFQLFDLQPSWSLKELARRTDQSEAHLKGTLKDLCNVQPDKRRRVYVLKPEYVRSLSSRGAQQQQQQQP